MKIQYLQRGCATQCIGGSSQARQSCATRFVWFIFCGGAFADVGNRLWCPRLVRRRAFGVGAARCFQDCFNKNATELFWNHPDYLRLASLLVLFLAMCSFCLKSSIPTCAFPFGGLEALDEHAANAKWHSTHSWFFQWLRQRQEKAAKPQTFPRWADIAMVGEGSVRPT